MITVAVGIIIDNGNVLLCQRKREARYPLKWEFPGGKVETGESVEYGLRRELFEELAIQAEVGALYHRRQYIYPDSGTFDVCYHVVPSFSGILVNRVFNDIAWVPRSELSRFDILEGNREVVRKLMILHESVQTRKT